MPALQVRLTCSICDLDFLKTAIGFVEFVEESDSTPDVDVTTITDEAADRPWRVTFVGRGRFSGRDRVLHLSLASLGSTSEIRREIARTLRLGLVEYAVETTAGPKLDVTFRPLPVAQSLVIVSIQGPDLDVSVRRLPAVAPTAGSADRWKNWVFHLTLESDGSGERSAFDRTYYVGASANRTTAGWKVRIGGSRALSRSSFTVSEESTVTSRVSEWSADALVVRSAGPHFSLGVTSTVAGSTFSNEKFIARLSPAVEYDVFSYDESTRRSLTIQYTAGRAHYDYVAETIFGKLTETVAQQAVNVSLGLKQPWGQVGSTVVFTQQLTEPDRTRTTLFGNLSVRISRHLSVNGSGSYARIRDQFTLEKGDASEEEVLLRQRQLATGHRYSASVGLTISFGALSNAAVNPRFAR
jgi:hypothetical protein